MAQIVNIQPLRVQGIRVADPPRAMGGYFRVTNQGGHTALALVGHRSGEVLLGPLFDPKLIAAEPDGFVLCGMEALEGTDHTQEWMVIVARPDPAPPDIPLW